MTVYPYGYGTECLDIDGLFARVESEAGGPMHPEFRWWLWRWLEGQSGLIGIGDGWRPHGSDTSGASSANKSFHQTQTFASGRSTWCAVDVVAVNPGGVHRTVQWHEVPEQGSTDAAYWNVHANVPGEPWHIQPVNIDGFDSWVAAGRPDPIPAPVYEPDPPEPEDDVSNVLVLEDARNGTWYRCGPESKTWVQDGHMAEQLNMRLAETGQDGVAVDGFRYHKMVNGNVNFIASTGPIIGPRPPGVDDYGR